MKLFTFLLLAGVLMECITVLIASPLATKTLSSKATDKTLQRSKREPDVALVLSIIDKNSHKRPKLQIEMDGDEYKINDRNSKLKSAVGKRLIDKLLAKGELKLNSDVEEDNAKNHRWEELLEILKEASKCKKQNSSKDSERSKLRSDKAKPKPKPKSSDDDNKLDMILQLLEKLKNKDDDVVQPETQQDDKKSEPPGTEDIEIQSSNEEFDVNDTEGLDDSHETHNDEDTEEPIIPEPKPEDSVKENSEEEPEAEIKRKPEPEPEQIESEEEEPQKEMKIKPKPDHIVEENSEEELPTPIKRKPRPDHIVEENSEEELPTPIKRKPRPDHIADENSEEELPTPIKRKPRPDHIVEENSEEELPTPIKRKPRPHHIVEENSEEELPTPIKRRPRPDHIVEENSEEELPTPIKRKPRPKHIVEENSEEELPTPIKRKPRPDHIVEENSEEELPTPIKRKPRPDHIVEENSEEELPTPIKRRPRPKHIVEENSEEELPTPIKRKPKPSHIAKENSEKEPSKPIKRLPKHEPTESEEEPKDTVKRRPKPNHNEKENSEEENDKPKKRRPKPELDEGEESDEAPKEPINRNPKPEHKENTEDDSNCEDCDGNTEEESSDEDGTTKKIVPKQADENTDEPGTSDEEEEENETCTNDLDEEQLLNGIAFVQNQLKRFLGIECTCQPAENTVLSECPLHKKSLGRSRREDQKERVLNVRSSGEHAKNIIKHKKFTKKATLKDLKKDKKQPKKITKKDSSSTAVNNISKARVQAKPNTENILKMLRELGISARIVKPTSKVSTADSQSKKQKTNSDDLQYFRNKSSVHRSRSKPSQKRNLRNRRKGTKYSTPSTSKRTQRDITSEEIAAQQEEGTSLHNYQAEGSKGEILLSRPLDSSFEDVDHEVESLKNIFDKYKKRVGEIKRNENLREHTVVESEHEEPHDSNNKDGPVDVTESDLTESLENILKQISNGHGNDSTDDDEDSSAEKEYVVAHDSDSNYRNLYNKFSTMFGDKNVMNSQIHSDADGTNGDK